MEVYASLRLIGYNSIGSLFACAERYFYMDLEITGLEVWLTSNAREAPIALAYFLDRHWRIRRMAVQVGRMNFLTSA
jgi:hypothetical protein